jgi:2-hydroxy-3-keto-5-methylthiopentenyl-1-phosphate phosphatase
MPHGEKIQHIKQWWEQDFSAFASCNFTDECFKKMVVQSRIMFRFGAIDLIQWARDKEIPMVVMSAGISEVINASFNLLGSVEHA